MHLLAVGGGPISAVEYRLALALRAKVGILDPGREAKALLLDPVWQSAKELGVLRPDPEQIAAFLGS